MAPSRFVFLDRDGVINTYQRNAYVNTPDQFEFFPGSLEAIVELKRRGIGVIVISNQAGVGKGLMSLESLEAITEKMKREVEAAGGEIADVLYCTHRPDEGCNCRKPRPGMLQEAARRHGIDLASTVFIGDAPSDWEAAKAAGCPFILVFSGKTSAAEAQAWAEMPSMMAYSLKDAIELLE